MADSFERAVFAALKTKLSTLSWVTTVEYERVRLTISDWPDDKLPVIQFWFDEELFTQLRQRVETDLRITIEMVMKTTKETDVTQGVVLDRLRDIRELLGSDPTLGINGMMYNVVLVRAARDFVTQDPHKVAQLQISVTGIVPYGEC